MELILSVHRFFQVPPVLHNRFQRRRVRSEVGRRTEEAKGVRWRGVRSRKLSLSDGCWKILRMGPQERR